MRLAALCSVSCLAVLAGCGPRAGDAACGITALAGATMLLDQFKVPRQTLTEPPVVAPPPLLPVRVAAGPAMRGRLSLLEGGWRITVEGTLPPEAGTPGFAVLVVGRDGTPRGVMLFAGLPVQGAPSVGRVQAGALDLPLLGLQTDVAGLEDPACPFFPDSLRR